MNSREWGTEWLLSPLSGTSCTPTNGVGRHMPPDRNQLLTVADVLNVTGFKSRTTLYRRARSGSFPCPCHIGSGKIRWRSGDVEDWLNGLQPRRY